MKQPPDYTGRSTWNRFVESIGNPLALALDDDCLDLGRRRPVVLQFGRLSRRQKSGDLADAQIEVSHRRRCRIRIRCRCR